MTVTINGTTGITTPAMIMDTLTTNSFTVATLPAAGIAGRRTHVTNALLPVWGSTVAGGGSVKVPVFDNGSNWIVG